MAGRVDELHGATNHGHCLDASSQCADSSAKRPFRDPPPHIKQKYLRDYVSIGDGGARYIYIYAQ